jgi:sugar/nucleoside kinase (ribokinase family)
LADLEELLPYIDYILPNRDEIALLTGKNDPFANAKLLIEAGVGCAVIKCGKDGCLIRTKDECYKIPAYPVENALDSTGAGDCFAAGFLWGLRNGLSLEECGYFACATASCAVEHMGATDGVQSIGEPMKRYREMK